METIDINNRDYGEISHTAKTLLYMKALVGIPYAREAAELMEKPGTYVADYSNKDLSFWLRTVHFEARYQSIGQLLEGTNIPNILELSSGFSFRGLETTRDANVHYIDTDLPGVISQKAKMTEDITGDGLQLKGKLEILPLNALDEAAFDEAVARFEAGPIAIVNEGLLMYLDLEEKEQLCAIIHKTLKQRGGYWITADVYIKNPPAASAMHFEDELQAFLDAQRVEEKKFDSFEAAEAFFRKCGFVVDKEAEIDYGALTAMPYLLKCIPETQLADIGKSGKIHATWRLKIAEPNR